MEILWNKPGNNLEKLQHNVPGWKQQEEAGRAAGGGRSWILRKTARSALLFFWVPGKSALCKPRKLDYQNDGFPSKLFSWFQPTKHHFPRESGSCGASADSLDPVSGTPLPPRWHLVEVTGQPSNLHTHAHQVPCTWTAPPLASLGPLTNLEYKV